MTTPDQAFWFKGRVLTWFSCGAASAVAAKLAVDKYRGDKLEVLYCDTSADEHEDNPRFMKDVEQWIQFPIWSIGSRKFKTTDEVFIATRYISGVNGARCTAELKRVPRVNHQRPEDIHIFGLTSDEQDRIDQFETNNPAMFLEWILRDAGITKQHCYQIIQAAGIKLPEMYLKGYRNNNCKGCVKSSSPGYWAKVRVDFPEVFKRRCEVSRSLGVRLLKLHGERVFLDELPNKEFSYKGEDLSCGPQCQTPTEEQ